MVFKVREVRVNLVNKGFVLDRKGHHQYLYFYYHGKRAGPYTLTSHGKPADDVGPDNVRKMKLQLALDTNQQVHGLVDCTLTEAQYIKILRNKGKIPAE